MVLFNQSCAKKLLRCPNEQGVHVPVAPDLAQTMNVGSDQFENSTTVFGGAKNGIFKRKFPNIF